MSWVGMYLKGQLSSMKTIFLNVQITSLFWKDFMIQKCDFKCFSYIEIDDYLLTVCFQRLILVYYLFINLTSIHTFRFSFTFWYCYYHVSYRNLFFDGNTLVCTQTVEFYSYSLMINLFGTFFHILIIYLFICIIYPFFWNLSFWYLSSVKLLQLCLELYDIDSLSGDPNNIWAKFLKRLLHVKIQVHTLHEYMVEVLSKSSLGLCWWALYTSMDCQSRSSYRRSNPWVWEVRYFY